MDKTAIEALAKLAIAGEASQKLVNHNLIVLPKDYVIENLERYEEQPNSYRAKFDTNLFSDFTAYVNEWGDEATQVFIDDHKMIAKAIIDMGDPSDPGWGEHRATLALANTPAYGALCACENIHLSQQEFIDFCEDWEDCIQFVVDIPGSEEDENVDFRKTLQTFRRLKVNTNTTTEQTVNNFSSSRSALESLEVQAGQDQLPDAFRFQTIPYEDFKPAFFYCRLRTINDDKQQVKIKYRILQKKSIIEAIAYEFREKLKATFDDDIIHIFIGTMNSYQRP